MSKIDRAIAAFKYGGRVDRYRFRFRLNYRRYGNRTRLRLNLCHYTIDRDAWLARHGQSTSLNRSPRAREALSELNLFRIGIPRRFIVAIRKMHEAKFKATPHPKFKPS